MFLYPNLDRNVMPERNYSETPTIYDRYEELIRENVKQTIIIKQLQDKFEELLARVENSEIEKKNTETSDIQKGFRQITLRSVEKEIIDIIKEKKIIGTPEITSIINNKRKLMGQKTVSKQNVCNRVRKLKKLGLCRKPPRGDIEYVEEVKKDVDNA